ncbi:MAG: UDP-N-acetylmuramyl tripeptide synthase [Patescibacteria group bacterium]|nr:UDP-N-acetylmuramyl tripeptide synthase [Patescibacteria group bacterium]
MIKNQRIIKRVVQEMGGTIEKIIPERSYYYIKLRGEKIFINKKFVIDSDLFSRKQPTNFKDLTYIFLKENNIPTPNTVCFYRKTITEEKLNEELGKLSYPIVVKDASGSYSLGVFTDIKNSRDAKQLILREIEKFPCLVTQEMIFGKEYRILVLEDKIIGALEMIPPRIFGNGESTTKELIEKKQENTEKRTPLDAVLTELLQKQGETLASTPKEGKEIFLRTSSCLAEGGETADSTDIVNEEIKLLCVKAAKAVDKKLTGLDIICDDITKSPSKQRINILEANRRPDLYIHYNPTHGKTRDVVRYIIEFILELKKNSDLK